MARFQDYLNFLWSNVIEDMDVNVLNHTIKFKTLSIDKGITTRHELIFEEVSSFFFVGNTGEQRCNLPPAEEGDFLELTSIDYFPQGVGQISISSESEQWAEQYFSGANFSIEIWSSFLFIEAGKFVIDGNLFEEKSFL